MVRAAAALGLSGAGLGTLSAAVAFGALGPRRADLPSHLLDAGAWAGWASGRRPDEIVATGAGLAAYAVIGWLAVGLLAALASLLPGTVGHVGARLADGVTPSVLRHLVAAAVGAALGFGTTVPAQASGSGSDPAGLDWPAATASRQSSTTALPPSPAAARAPSPATVAGARPVGPDVVTVHPGDCLWSITASHLPGHPTTAQIAAHWPRWYAANRAVIGPDPGLVLPGQRLVAPD